ncbi:hypothetical protein C2845_PM14G08680 [Panicum miliaceum]|uniref:FAD-binding PCMH-type domain-containing protein n=1 Tax=Panicum miliaceum TaxID=4540 RepID=A0A3L6PP18_PANMI|nr:hypothetical protein C2845_PM14G08680 [Panicum miliaceum]
MKHGEGRRDKPDSTPLSFNRVFPYSIQMEFCHRLPPAKRRERCASGSARAAVTRPPCRLILSFLLLSTRHNAAASENGVHAGASRSLASCLVASGVRNFSLAGSPGYASLLGFSVQNLRFALPGGARRRCVGHRVGGVRRHAGRGLPRRGGSASPNGSSSSSSLAFAAGSCSTVGVGGHVSGGGFGLLSRKFMLAADNALDALLVDAEGRVLDRGAMGEDVFWAIRGSGGGSWGVVYAWKLRLVPVPDTVTLFTPRREGSVDAIARLVHRWQFAGPALPDEFYLSVFLTIGGASQEDTNVTVSFTGLVLGPRELAMSVLSERFPELDLAETELSEMSWFAGLSSAEELTSRVSKTKHYGKNKSDYVKQPIARDALAAILRYLSAGPAGYVILDPYGGAMARAGATDTPFPHRAGNLYGVTWEAGEDGEARMAWLRALYAYMAPHVSCSPRAAYVNYINLDLGTAAAANAANGSAATAALEGEWRPGLEPHEEVRLGAKPGAPGLAGASGGSSWR